MSGDRCSHHDRACFWHHEGGARDAAQHPAVPRWPHPRMTLPHFQGSWGRGRSRRKLCFSPSGASQEPVHWFHELPWGPSMLRPPTSDWRSQTTWPPQSRAAGWWGGWPESSQVGGRPACLSSAACGPGASGVGSRCLLSPNSSLDHGAQS